MHTVEYYSATKKNKLLMNNMNTFHMGYANWKKPGSKGYAVTFPSI